MKRWVQIVIVLILIAVTVNVGILNYRVNDLAKQTSNLFFMMVDVHGSSIQRDRRILDTLGSNFRDVVEMVGELSLDGVDTIVGKRLSDSVVLVMNEYGGWGSGFAISANEFITARHIVRSNHNNLEDPNISGTKYKVMGYCGAEFDVVSIDQHPTLDIAIVRIEEEVFTPLEIDLVGDYQVGDSVFAIGTPKSKTFHNILTSGTIAGRDRTDVYHPVEWKNVFVVDMSLWFGSSGSPIFNEEGVVIGMFVGGYMPVLNVCIPLHVVSDWELLVN